MPGMDETKTDVLPRHLNQEEFDYFNSEGVHLTRCEPGCGHLNVFHVYVGGNDRCIICGCER